MRNQMPLLVLASLFLFSSFTSGSKDDKQPKTITKMVSVINGNQVERTIVLFDGNTSKEDVINTCNFLSHENVQLTFDKLTIGKSFLGLAGKTRIRIAEGKINLPNGSSQSFKAGGATSFRFIKIQYTNNLATKSAQIEMIEIID